MSQRREDGAINAAARFARRYWVPDTAFRASVRAAETKTESYRRALHVIERRSVEMRCEPAVGLGRRAVEPLPDAREVDPWDVDVAELERRSRVLATCPTCSGTKRATCSYCAGSDTNTCPECNGARFVAGQRGPRQCPTCRARGTVRCHACHRGTRSCDTCNRTGRVHAWLTIERQQITQVRADTDSGVTRAHARMFQPEDFDAHSDEWPHALTRDTGTGAPLSKGLGDLTPALSGPHDRVVSTRIQEFSAVVTRVGYALGPFVGELDVAGRSPAVTATSVVGPLIRRRYAICAAAVVVGTIGLFAPVGYLARHAWFREYGQAGWLAVCCIAGTLAAPVAVSGLCLAKRARSVLLTWIPLAMFGLALLFAIALSTAWGPSARRANAALNTGDLERAETEADALIALGVDSAAGGDVIDGVRIARLQHLEAIDALVLGLSRPWHSAQRQAAAVALVRSRVDARMHALHERRDADGLDRLAATIASFDAGIHDVVVALAWLARAELSLSRDDIEGALTALGHSAAAPAIDVANTRGLVIQAALRAFTQQLAAATGATEPRAKRDALGRVLVVAKQLGSLNTSTSPTAVEIEAQIASVKPQADLLDARDAERARIEAERRRREEEARRRIEEQKRKLEEAREHEANRSVLCSDGWVSGCLCHAGSHRGCCSHHGGMAGCAP